MTKIEYRYLNTKNIKVTLKFTQPIHLAHEVVESLEYQSTDKVNLNIPCPCIGCIKGGFDISTDIESTVKKTKTTLVHKTNLSRMARKPILQQKRLLMQIRVRYCNQQLTTVTARARFTYNSYHF